jgi:hypothetical protein
MPFLMNLREEEDDYRQIGNRSEDFRLDFIPWLLNFQLIFLIVTINRMSTTNYLVLFWILNFLKYYIIN